jgi:Zn-dependent M28 family amino/carboxypeptidase
MTRFVTTLVLLASAVCAGAQAPGMDEARMHERVRYLASDELQGRAPGSEGERLTLEYLTRQFEGLGLAPGNPDGSYLQEVPLVGVTCRNEPTFRIEAIDGSYERSLRYGSEYMGWTLHQNDGASVEKTEFVFVGYGTVAPEYEWDDYKDVDVAGKIIVMLVNDPPLPDETQFGGKAMTYYGRWTYKYEIAAARGAAGAIIVHNSAGAGYGWAVVENSWKGEQFDIVRKDQGLSRCRVETWITEPVARDLFAAAGKSYDQAIHDAVSRDFRPYSLGLAGSLAIENKVRQFTSHNVVAMLPGVDDRLSREHIIYTSHWDHLGVGNEVDGDAIYNGAMDNASGVAGMLEVAAAFTERREDLKRSVLFLITTAEESGLIGAKHYCEYPLYPLADAVANINADGVNIWGPTLDMVVVGWGQSDLDEYIEQAVSPEDRYVVPDSEPEKGYYYRSDHFPFAQKGVPALYADSGVLHRDRPDGWGIERRNEYVRLRYHKPQDEYDASWDLSGAMEDMSALFRVGLALAVSDRYPRWSDTSEFKRAREQLLDASP